MTNARKDFNTYYPLGLCIMIYQLIHLLTVMWEKLKKNISLFSIYYFAGGVA